MMDNFEEVTREIWRKWGELGVTPPMSWGELRKKVEDAFKLGRKAEDIIREYSQILVEHPELGKVETFAAERVAEAEELVWRHEELPEREALRRVLKELREQAKEYYVMAIDAVDTTLLMDDVLSASAKNNIWQSLIGAWNRRGILTYEQAETLSKIRF